MRKFAFMAAMLLMAAMTSCGNRTAVEAEAVEADTTAVVADTLAVDTLDVVAVADTLSIEAE